MKHQPGDVAVVDQQRVIVAVGASAGGLDALKALLGAMPPDTELAFVVVVHLDPAHESLLPELLAKATTLRVEQARDGQPVEAGHVYVIPSNRTLTVVQGVIHLQEVEDRQQLRGVIDRCFRSLAADQGARAAAIVLSGTGTEGTLGAQAIKAEGGLVLVQTPDSASQPGMPASAIASGRVDLVLAPEKMPEALLAYVRSGHANQGAPAPEHAEPLEGLPAVLAIVAARTKFDFHGYKTRTLSRRIERRMGLLQIDALSRYVDVLRSEPDEVDRLFRDLLIGVTAFHRDPPAFEELAKVVAGLLKGRDAGSPVRVWVPGCATGEEAYSIAMVLAEQQATVPLAGRVQIFATDVNDQDLNVARAGSYPESIALDVTPDRLRRFFTLDDHRYTVTKSLRASVVFAEHNLLRDPPFSKLDLVSCRNVFIYLEPEAQRTLLAQFHFALNPEGVLFLGRAEGVGPLEHWFAPISKRCSIFRRAGMLTPSPLEVPAPWVRASQADWVRPAAPAESSAAALADRHLLQHFGITAVVVRASGQIVRFYGRMHRYLRLPMGEPTFDVRVLARDALKPALRVALHDAVELHHQVVTATLPAGRRGDATLRITVTPLDASKTAEPLWLVIFDESPSRSRAVVTPQAEGTTDDLVRQLEADLQTVRKEEQQLVEQLEGSIQDRRVAHEQLTSMNEELQAANEELNSSSEELQSMNEELATLNAELQDKVHDLTVVNDDLANLLVSTDVPTVFVDTHLRITRMTSAASRLLGLEPADIGWPMAHAASSLVNTELSRDARRVLDSAISLEREITVEATGRHFILRAAPNVTTGGAQQGVVLTLLDVTALKTIEGDLRTAREKASMDLQRMTRLHEASVRVSGPGEFHEILEEILGAAMEMTGADMGYVQERGDGDALVIAAQVGLKPHVLDHFARVDTGTDSASRAAMADQRRVMVDDLTESPLFRGTTSLNVLVAAGVRAMQSTPLFDRSEGLLGMLSTLYTVPHHFDDAEQQWLDLLAGLAGDIMQRRRAETQLAHATATLERHVSERTSWLVLLHDVTRAISNASTWIEALHAVLHRICDADHWQVGYVYLPEQDDPDTLIGRISHVSDERFQRFHLASEPLRFARGESLPGHIYAEGTPQWVNQQEDLLALLPRRAEAARQAGLTAAVAMPIRFGRDVMAVLELFSDQTHVPNPLLANLMSDIGSQIGAVLERERVTAQMADLVWREQQELLHTLHDSLGQTLTGLGMLASGLSQHPTGANVSGTASEIARQAQVALEQVRQLSRGLFPVEVDAGGLMPALRELASTTENFHGIHVGVGGEVPDTLRDSRVATQLYRIAQEAVTNSVKHAKAKTISIVIGLDAGAPQLRVVDDGVGMGARAMGHGLGLRIMRYRATSIGGGLTFESASGGGTAVICTLRGASPFATSRLS